MDTKLTDNLFQYLLILSIPLVMCFYWPSHDQRLMKFVCFEMVLIILFSLSFLFEQKRDVKNIWPSLFILVCVLNMFTHLMAGFTQVAFTFCLFSVMAIYTIQRSATLETVLILKKSIVVSALINFCLFITQYFGIVSVFDALDCHSRPSGFMVYPTHFSLLCAIAFLFAWDWNKWLCVPLIIGVLLSHEYAVILGLVISLLVSFRNINSFLSSLPVVALLIIGAIFLKVHASGNDLLSRFHLRNQFWYPTFRLCWARPIDGFGMGGYKEYFSVIAPSFQKGIWPELHCEPLQLFFEMGLLGCAIFFGWFKRMTKCFTWNVYSKSILIVCVCSCFHSIFHFCDSLWLIICIYSMWEIDRVEGIC